MLNPVSLVVNYGMAVAPLICVYFSVSFLLLAIKCSTMGGYPSILLGKHMLHNSIKEQLPFKKSYNPSERERSNGNACNLDFSEFGSYVCRFME